MSDHVTSDYRSPRNPFSMGRSLPSFAAIARFLFALLVGAMTRHEGRAAEGAEQIAASRRSPSRRPIIVRSNPSTRSITMS